MNRMPATNFSYQSGAAAVVFDVQLFGLTGNRTQLTPAFSFLISTSVKKKTSEHQTDKKTAENLVW